MNCRTEEEAKAAKTLPTGELLERGPAVCSHTVSSMVLSTNPKGLGKAE